MPLDTEPQLQRYLRADLDTILKQDLELFSVDPGKKHAAISFFCNGQLEDITLVQEEGPLEVALAATVWIKGHCSDPQFGCDVLVTEMQQIYPGIRAQDPNDLLPLAEVVGGIHALVYAPQRIKPLPRTWKGTTAKQVFLNRTLRDLTDNERKIFEGFKCAANLKHNLLDSIALGKWAIKNHVAN